MTSIKYINTILGEVKETMKSIENSRVNKEFKKQIKGEEL
jgi:hypothetical protein